MNLLFSGLGWPEKQGFGEDSPIARMQIRQSQIEQQSQLTSFVASSG
jgi:hypothetical protein